MALKQNFGAQLSDPEHLKRIAARLGYKQTRGSERGKGSIRQLLEAVITGEAIVIVKPVFEHTVNAFDENERHEHAINELERRGVISRRATRKGTLSPFNPIKIEGEEVSQMIIRERR